MVIHRVGCKPGVVGSYRKYPSELVPVRYWRVIVFACLLAADQTSKWFFAQLEGESYIFKPLGLGIRYLTHRKYHMWRLLSVNDEYGLIGIPLILLVLAFWYLVYRFLSLKLSDSTKSIQLGFVLVCGGLVGNLSDKLILRCARDFLVVPPFGVTNFADLFYYCGGFLLLLVFLRNRRALKTEKLFLFFRDEVTRVKIWLGKWSRK